MVTLLYWFFVGDTSSISPRHLPRLRWPLLIPLLLDQFLFSFLHLRGPLMMLDSVKTDILLYFLLNASSSFMLSAAHNVLFFVLDLRSIVFHFLHYFTTFVFLFVMYSKTATVAIPGEVLKKSFVPPLISQLAVSLLTARIHSGNRTGSLYLLRFARFMWIQCWYEFNFQNIRLCYYNNCIEVFSKVFRSRHEKQIELVFDGKLSRKIVRRWLLFKRLYSWSSTYYWLLFSNYSRNFAQAEIQ